MRISECECVNVIGALKMNLSKLDAVVIDKKENKHCIGQVLQYLWQINDV